MYLTLEIVPIYRNLVDPIILVISFFLLEDHGVYNDFGHSQSFLEYSSYPILILHWVCQNKLIYLEQAYS